MPTRLHFGQRILSQALAHSRNTNCYERKRNSLLSRRRDCQSPTGPRPHHRDRNEETWTAKVSCRSGGQAKEETDNEPRRPRTDRSSDESSLGCKEEGCEIGPRLSFTKASPVYNLSNSQPLPTNPRNSVPSRKFPPVNPEFPLMLARVRAETPARPPEDAAPMERDARAGDTQLVRM